MNTTLMSTLLLAVVTLTTNAQETGFESLMDGKTFKGWTMAKENQDTWSIADKAFVAKGPRCHLFYTGSDKPFKDFHLKLEVMTRPGSNGGVYFHTAYQEQGWPQAGFECQVNVTHKDWRRTGSLYGLVNTGIVTVKDNQWWTQEIIVKGKEVTVLINGQTLLNYVEPQGATPGKSFERVLNQGTFALQGHDPNSEVHYRNIRVKRLDD